MNNQRRLRAAFGVAAVFAGPAWAEGDPQRGERVFQYCYACHTIDPAETQMLQGPSLVGIVGRRIAAQEGFDYSPAMRAFAAEHGVWSEDLLDRFIASPFKLVPKTTMGFRGVDDDQERSDLMGFLKAKSP